MNLKNVWYRKSRLLKHKLSWETSRYSFQHFTIPFIQWRFYQTSRPLCSSRLPLSCFNAISLWANYICACNYASYWWHFKYKLTQKMVGVTSHPQPMNEFPISRPVIGQLSVILGSYWLKISSSSSLFIDDDKLWWQIRDQTHDVLSLHNEHWLKFSSKVLW